MSRINLTNLETVCCINRLGSFSAAARRMNASQPAITARVRELEQSVGFALFQRRGRRMELTVDGRQFVSRVEPLLSQLDDAVRVHSHPTAMQGVIRLGVGVTTMSWFPGLIAQLKKDMPLVQYDIEVDMGAGLLHKLEAGTLDIAVVAGEVHSARLVAQPLTPFELQWLMSARVPRVVDGKVLSLAELLNSAPLWFVARPSEFFPRALEATREHGAHLHNVNTCSDSAAMIEMIVKTEGIGMVPSVLAARYLLSGALVPMTPRLCPVRFPMSVVCHVDQQQTMMRHIVQRIVSHDATLGAARADEESSLRGHD